MEKTPFGGDVFPQRTLSTGVFSKIKMAKVELNLRTSGGDHGQAEKLRRGQARDFARG
jgi:hypothetical protein